MTTASTPQANPTADAEDLPFKGLRVLDCASFIAAPVAGTVMGDYGADVIKIEPTTGDSFRELFRSPGMPDTERNYPWELMSRNKRSLALDLKQPEALAALHRLVAQADVFITNQPLPVRRKLGITYEALKHLNPRLIYASFTAYGETGPEADKSGFDSTVYWARTGLMDLMRASGDAQPIRSLPGMGDMPSGMTLYAAIVTALYQRTRTGKGGQVDVSLLGCGVWSNAWMAQARLFGTDIQYRPPRTHTPNAIGNSYMTRDGRWLNLAVLNEEKQIGALLQALDLPALEQDPRFATVALRRTNHMALIPMLDEVFAQRELSEWRSRLDEAGITYGVIGIMDDMMSDGQMRIAGAVVPLGDEETVGSPIHLQGVRKVPAGPAPSLGEHSSQVLREGGFSEQEIAQLRALGAVI